MVPVDLVVECLLESRSYLVRRKSGGSPLPDPINVGLSEVSNQLPIRVHPVPYVRDREDRILHVSTGSISFGIFLTCHTVNVDDVERTFIHWTKVKVTRKFVYVV